jgi:hypothetical protein
MKSSESCCILGLDNFKAFGNAIHMCVPSVRVPVEAVIEQESNAVKNVKGISTMRVIRERPDPKELLA